MEIASIVDKIDALLPQTQCRKCAYPGCRPYAEAIAAGRAEINQCPPGGDAGVRALADLLGRDPKPLNPDHGQPTPGGVAVIDEQTCIGCTLCIQACPVDAILGAAKFMHTVIEQECTGCELCIAPCPVECIVLKPFDPALSDWKQPFTGFGRERAERARRRHQIHLARTERDKQERAAKLRHKAHPADSADLKRALIKAAVARVKAKRALAGRWP